jgi:hypothetical protein
MQTYDSPETRKRKALEEERLLLSQQQQHTTSHPTLRPNILELSLPPLENEEDRDIKRMQLQQGRASKVEKEEKMDDHSEEEKVSKN